MRSARSRRARAPPMDAHKLYTLFPNLSELRRRPGGRMSGGEQQMLTIARTLMGNPALVLLDEPSEGLAPKLVEQMAHAVAAMKKEGLSIVLSEQNLHFARLISDRAYIIEKGRIRFGGTMAHLEARPMCAMPTSWSKGLIERGLAPATRVQAGPAPTCSTSRSASCCAKSVSGMRRSSRAHGPGHHPDPVGGAGEAPRNRPMFPEPARPPHCNGCGDDQGRHRSAHETGTDPRRIRIPRTAAA